MCQRTRIKELNIVRECISLILKTWIKNDAIKPFIGLFRDGGLIFNIVSIIATSTKEDIREGATIDGIICLIAIEAHCTQRATRVNDFNILIQRVIVGEISGAYFGRIDALTIQFKNAIVFIKAIRIISGAADEGVSALPAI